MLIGNLIALLIILFCIGYQFQKSTLLKSFATFIIVLSAGAAAFAFFEPLAGILLSRGEDSSFEMFMPWAQTISFGLLFLVVFAVLQTLLGRLTMHATDLGNTAERVGRVIFGFLMGLVLSGIVLTILLISPLPGQYPYPRFESVRPDPENPDKVFLSPDGFFTGWFGLLSRGSFSGKRSFAALHPSFLDEVFLNRLEYYNGIPIFCSSEDILVPRRKGDEEKAAAVRPAPEELKNSKGKSLPAKSRHHLTIVRIGIPARAVNQAGQFTTSQLRLICKPKRAASRPLSGKSRIAYPLGYMVKENRLKIVRLTEHIKLSYQDLEESSQVKWLDFGFYVPDGYIPVFAGFKQNVILELPAPVTLEQAPSPATYNPDGQSADSRD